MFELLIHILSPDPYPTSSPPQVVRRDLSEDECNALRRGIADILRPEIATEKAGVFYVRCRPQGDH